jgi:sensor histidine kinase YesM
MNSESAPIIRSAVIELSLLDPHLHNVMDKPARNSNSNRKHIYLMLFTCIPVYWGFLLYISLATRQETEELAVAASVGFYCFIYAGRYLQGMLAGSSYRRLWTVGVSLAALIILCLLWLFAYTHYRVVHHGIHLLFYILPVSLMSVALGMLIKLIRNYVERQVSEARASAAQSESELHLLQSQLSPHFLFNTLNNLYGLSITRHEQIPPLLLKLSELLRYSVYDTKALFVPLQEEVSYLSNYLTFEKIRIGDRLSLSENISGMSVDRQVLIVPMLLIVFIENAFKHAKNTDEELISVTFNLQVINGIIEFYAANSHESGRTQTAVNQHSGLGLENVARRLELLYPNAYELSTSDTDNRYEVNLKLKIR